MRTILHRSRLIDRLRRRLDSDSYPRLQMSLLVAMTGGAGFVASFVLLLAGMQTMWSRYLVALVIAYLCFLFLLWVWLRTRADHYADVAELVPVPNIHVRTGASAAEPHFCGQGGSFDGGGASGNFENMNEPLAVAAQDSSTFFEESAGAVCEAEEFALPIVAIMFVVSLVLSSFWIIHAAPLLFAELMIDGALAASLYQRLRTIESRHWLETAVRRTIKPFAVVAVLLVAAGWMLQAYAPHAQTVSQALFMR